MKKAFKKDTKDTNFLETFLPKIKRSRSKPRTRIKRLLRQALSFQDKEIIEELYRKFIPQQ